MPARLDLKYAIVSALAVRARSDQYNRLLEYSEHLPAEFSVLLVSMLVAKDPEAVSGAPSWNRWASRYSEVLINREMI